MKVYVTEISHRHGRDLCLNATEAGATAALLAYVEACWSEVFAEEGHGSDNDPKPEKNFDDTKPIEMIDAYFGARQDEYVDIHGWEEVGP